MLESEKMKIILAAVEVTRFKKKYLEYHIYHLNELKKSIATEIIAIVAMGFVIMVAAVISMQWKKANLSQVMVVITVIAVIKGEF